MPTQFTCGFTRAHLLRITNGQERKGVTQPSIHLLRQYKHKTSTAHRRTVDVVVSKKAKSSVAVLLLLLFRHSITDWLYILTLLLLLQWSVSVQEAVALWFRDDKTTTLEFVSATSSA